MTSVSECGAEPMAARFELGAQLGEVVDLAVEDDPDRAVLVGHRLIAGGEIDDAQPAVRRARCPRRSRSRPRQGRDGQPSRPSRESTRDRRARGGRAEFAGDAAHGAESSDQEAASSWSRSRPPPACQARRDKSARNPRPCGRTRTAVRPSRARRHRAPPAKCGRSIRSITAAASAAGRFRARPAGRATPLSMSSGMPPTREATIGSPAAMASRTPFGNWLRIVRAARRDPRREHGRDIVDRSPRNCTCRPSPFASTSRRSNRIERSAADDEELCVGHVSQTTSAAAAMSVSWPFSGLRLATVDDAADRPARQSSRGKRRAVDAIRDDANPVGRNAFTAELRGRGCRVRNHDMGDSHTPALTRELTAASCPG